MKVLLSTPQTYQKELFLRPDLRPVRVTKSIRFIETGVPLWLTCQARKRGSTKNLGFPTSSKQK